jgi:hypothetical protein
MITAIRIQDLPLTISSYYKKEGIYVDNVVRYNGGTADYPVTTLKIQLFGGKIDRWIATRSRWVKL